MTKCEIFSMKSERQDPPRVETGRRFPTTEVFIKALYFSPLGLKGELFGVLFMANDRLLSCSVSTHI